MQVGIIIPDSAQEMIDKWAEDDGLQLVLIGLGGRELAKAPIRFNGPLPPPWGRRCEGTVRIEVDFRAFIVAWRVDGLPGEWINVGGDYNPYIDAVPGDAVKMTIEATGPGIITC
jgi:hypothetical protein